MLPCRRSALGGASLRIRKAISGSASHIRFVGHNCVSALACNVGDNRLGPGLKFQIAVRIVLFVLAALLAGAHFLRAGHVELVALCLIAPLLLLYRKRWILILLQIMAYCAAANWIATAVQIVQLRQLEGRSWTIAAIILGTVAAFTMLAGLLLNSRSMTERYPR